MEEHGTYNFGMCNAAVYLMKTLLCLFLLYFLFKDNTTLGLAEETSEKQKIFSIPRTCANYSLNRAAVAVSRVCSLRLGLLEQIQPEANKEDLLSNLTEFGDTQRQNQICRLISHFTDENSVGMKWSTHTGPPIGMFVE